MKNKDSSNPTPSELAILQILWKDGPSSVKHIHEKLSEEKEVVYTTILKTMQVMSEKGMLRRTAQGRKHIYQAAVNQDDTQDALLDKFLDKTFGGSASKLVLKALGNYNASQEELDQIKQFIEQQKNKKQ
jgi:predicted transcriptional regulator